MECVFSFQLHSSQLARPMDLICQVCEKHCANEERFFKHIHKYHPDYWRVFSGGRPLSDFIETKEPKRREKRFSCPICNKKYSHETGYVKHLATHPGSDPSLRLQLYSCPVNQCQKLFTKETYLMRHMEMKVDPSHTAALEEWKKRPPTEQVMMTRPITLPGEPLPHLDAGILSTMGPPPTLNPALQHYAVTTPLSTQSASPQNLTTRAPSPNVSQSAVTTDDGLKPVIVQPDSTMQQQQQQGLSSELASSDTFKFIQPKSETESLSPRQTPSTPSEIPHDLSTAVTSSSNLSPGPTHSSSSSPATPHPYGRSIEGHPTPCSTPFSRPPMVNALPTLSPSFTRSPSVPPNRSYSLNDLQHDTNFSKTPNPQEMYTKLTNVNPHPTPLPQHLSQYQRSPEGHVPRSPDSQHRLETINHYATESQLHNFSPSRPIDSHLSFVPAGFVHNHSDAVTSCSTTMSTAPPPPMHGVIPPPGAFLHPSMSPSYPAPTGLQGYPHIPRSAMGEHDVATALQNLARSLPNYSR